MWNQYKFYFVTVNGFIYYIYFYIFKSYCELLDIVLFEFVLFVHVCVCSFFMLFYYFLRRFHLQFFLLHHSSLYCSCAQDKGIHLSCCKASYLKAIWMSRWTRAHTHRSAMTAGKWNFRKIKECALYLFRFFFSYSFYHPLCMHLANSYATFTTYKFYCITCCYLYHFRAFPQYYDFE